MRAFRSSFAQRIQDFLDLKRTMGRRYQAVESELRRFDRYVAALEDPPETMTRELVHGWLTARSHVGPVTQRSRAGIIRQFCLYLVRLDPGTFVPDRALSPATLPIFKAHVYSVEELRALLWAVPAVVSARFALQRETLRTIVLLLYSTGLRAGEVSRLCIGDIDLAARTLFVRETKFFKSRLVPISESLTAELVTYLEKRGALAATSPRAPFLISRCRRSIPPRNLSFVFHELVKSAGIAARPGGHGPRMHDLRHTFAVRDPANVELCQRVLAVPVKRAPRRAVDYLEREELDAILGSVDRTTPEGRRDYALLAFASQTGTRVEEMVSVRACDIELDVLPQVRLWGKGRKQRIIPLWPSTAALLRGWMDERKIDPRGTAPVFVNLRGRRLTRWGVRYLVQKYARAAAKVAPTVAAKRIHPHVLRHTTAVHMLDAGADPSAIRDLFGHASAETTWRYTRLRMERKRKTIEACAPRGADTEGIPIWRRDPDLLAQLEAIGQRRDYVERPRR